MRRTGPSGEGRPRSVLWSCYLRAVLALGAGLSFFSVAFAFFCTFSLSALATAVRNAFASILQRLAASDSGSSSLSAVALPAGPRSMASKISTARAAASAFL